MSRKLLAYVAATTAFVALLSQAAEAATETVACLKAWDGTHRAVSEDDRHTVNANRPWCGAWEQHTIVDVNGGALQHGDQVGIISAWGLYWSAQENGRLEANRPHFYGWEHFTIEKVTGGDAVIRDGDQFALRGYHGLYVVAENAGGSIMNANRGARGPWETFTLELVAPPEPPSDATLRVTHPGDVVGAIRGTGDIWSTCRPECLRTLPIGTEVRLEASTVGDNTIEFDRWGGVCAGQGAVCTFTLDGDSHAELHMRRKPQVVDLVVRKPTATVEDVSVDPIGAVWYETLRRYDAGTVITLTAQDDTLHAARFVSWGGACAGQGRSCTLTLNSDTHVEVNYAQDPVYRLHVTHPGDAVGAIRGTDGIWSTCRPGCERQLAPGTEIRLEASTVGDNSIEFDRWEGACAGQGPICTFVLDGDASAALHMRHR